MSGAFQRTAVLVIATAAMALAGCGYRGWSPEVASGARAASSRSRLAFAGTSLPQLPPPSARENAPAPPHGDDAPLDFRDETGSSPAHRYASLDRAACEAELTRRRIPWTRVDEARGVLAPVRLTGPVGGVSYHSNIPVKDRATSTIEIFDCRLVLALDDFSAILRAHDVIEVVHMSAWRPPAKSWPSGKLGKRHDGALALDAGSFVRRDGSKLDVEKDFHGRIGSQTCGPNAGPWPATAEAIELRRIACETADAHLFNVELTPDYNWPHRNHFHLEVTPDVKWFLVH